MLCKRASTKTRVDLQDSNTMFNSLTVLIERHQLYNCMDCTSRPVSTKSLTKASNSLTNLEFFYKIKSWRKVELLFYVCGGCSFEINFVKSNKESNYL